MKKYLIIFICLWGGVGFSCSNWLDVKPSDRISEDNNFSSLVGFKKTLNGVYIELNSSDLYGKNLSCEFIEILAQRYAIGDENKSNKELMEFSYNGSAGRGKTTSICCPYINKHVLIIPVRHNSSTANFYPEEKHL